MFSTAKVGIVAALRSQILRLQGFRPAHTSVNARLGPLMHAFPNGSFPVGAIHEFLSNNTEDTAATAGFVSALMSTLSENNGVSIWICPSRTIFPPALKSFGLNPERILFVEVKSPKEALCTMEEALKCNVLTAVVGEIKDLDFTASRRLQLAVEQSKVTGFVLRNNCRTINTTACVSRWKISSLPSESIDDLPGIGFPKWKAELLRIRNGKPGTWNIQWTDGKFITAPEGTDYTARSLNINTKAG